MRPPKSRKNVRSKSPFKLKHDWLIWCNMWAGRLWYPAHMRPRFRWISRMSCNINTAVWTYITRNLSCSPTVHSPTIQNRAPQLRTLNQTTKSLKMLRTQLESSRGNPRSHSTAHPRSHISQSWVPQCQRMGGYLADRHHVVSVAVQRREIEQSRVLPEPVSGTPIVQQCFVFFIC